MRHSREKGSSQRNHHIERGRRRRTSLDLPPTIDEVSKAIKQISSGKSPGMDGIPAEIFKSAGPVALKAIHSLLTSIWEEEVVPKEFQNEAVRLTAATTGASLLCPSLGRSWLESSSTVSSPTSRRKTCRKPCRKPSVDSV